MKGFLRTLKSEVPTWLKNHVPGKDVDMNEVLASRIVYYPGSGDDGQPIQTFNQEQSAHVFMYVDYGVSRKSLESVLTNPGFAGYSRLDRIEIPHSDLIPNGWTPSISFPRHAGMFIRKHVTPFCFMDIYERKAEYDATHGSERFAVIFLFADGFAAYDAVFCSSLKRSPFILVLEDHGFGGNWNHFGAGGELEKIAARHGVYPHYMLVAEHSKAWAGYAPIPDVSYVVGGIHHSHRYMHMRKQQS